MSGFLILPAEKLVLEKIINLLSLDDGLKKSNAEGEKIHTHLTNC